MGNLPNFNEERRGKGDVGIRSEENGKGEKKLGGMKNSIRPNEKREGKANGLNQGRQAIKKKGKEKKRHNRDKQTFQLV